MSCSQPQEKREWQSPVLMDLTNFDELTEGGKNSSTSERTVPITTFLSRLYGPSTTT